MRFLAVLAAALAACDSSPPHPRPSPSPVPMNVVFHVGDLDATHLNSCDDWLCGGNSALPVGGAHCGNWLPCRVFTSAQKRCQWVHNLEHGHAALLYNCTDCEAEKSALVAKWQARQADPILARVLLTPDPMLPGRFGAAVWGWGWVSDTFDDAAIDEVLGHQNQDAPEAFMACEK